MFSNPRRLFLAMFALVILLISYNDIVGCRQQTGSPDLPFPPRFVATGIVFGMLDILSGILGDIAPLVGGGFVLAMLICTACPQGQCKQCNMMLTRSDCQARLAHSTSQPSEAVLLGASTGGTGQALA